jgi:hypothetical protein
VIIDSCLVRVTEPEHEAAVVAAFTDRGAHGPGFHIDPRGLVVEVTPGCASGH